jgi:hypothetical protein
MTEISTEDRKSLDALTLELAALSTGTSLQVSLCRVDQGEDL